MAPEVGKSGLLEIVVLFEVEVLVDVPNAVEEVVLDAVVSAFIGELELLPPPPPHETKRVIARSKILFINLNKTLHLPKKWIPRP